MLYPKYDKNIYHQYTKEAKQYYIYCWYFVSNFLIATYTTLQKLISKTLPKQMKTLTFNLQKLLYHYFKIHTLRYHVYHVIAWSYSLTKAQLLPPLIAGHNSNYCQPLGPHTQHLLSSAVFRVNIVDVICIRCGRKNASDICKPEWSHRQGGCLACWRLQDRFSAEAALIYIMHEGAAHEGGGATSQFDLLSLTSLSAAGCGRQQLAVTHRAASVDYCK